jgi:hypothetical protein
MNRTFTATTGKPVKMIGIYLELSAEAMRQPPVKKTNKKRLTSLTISK